MLAIAIICSLITTVASQSSVLFFTRVPNPITDGEPQAITWTSNDTRTPVTIDLYKGASDSLVLIATLTDNSSGGQFVWTPRLSLRNGANYALKIKQNNQENFFGPFTIQGAIPASVSAYYSHASSSFLPKSTSSKTTTKTHSSTLTTTTGDRTSTTLTRSSTRTSTGTAQASPADTGNSSSSGLSTGSAIGIGIAIAGSIAIAAVIAFLFYRRRSKAKKAVNNNSSPSTDASTAGPGEQSTSEMLGAKYEKDGKSPIPEMITNANTHELSGRSRPYELPGN